MKETLFSLDKKYSRNIIGLLVAHDGLNYYKFRLSFKENNLGKCRFCSSPKEDFYHIIFNCTKNPFYFDTFSALCRISPLFKNIYKKKDIKGILLPMFNLIRPGIFMNMNSCLNVYKTISLFMDKVLSWKEELNLPTNNKQWDSNISIDKDPIGLNNNNNINKNNTIKKPVSNDNSDISENVLKCTEELKENDNIEEDEEKSVILKKRKLPPPLETYDHSTFIDYQVVTKVVPPTKKKRKLETLNSESEDFDLLDSPDPKEDEVKDDSSVLYNTYSNKDMTKKGSVFDNG